MRVHCPYCKQLSPSSDYRTFSRSGYYRRKSDQRWIQRFKCLLCLKTFSTASADPRFRQLKRQFNQRVFELLASGVSQRRASYLLRLNRKTIKRKFLFLGLEAKHKLNEYNLSFPPSIDVEFDDLETFEHTKCKPLSVTLMVEGKTRRILGYSVAQMPAKGRLIYKALKKYGPRKDERGFSRKRFFVRMQPLVAGGATIRSDQNPHYPSDVKTYFPSCTHVTTKGLRGAITGQGELKKTQFDPLFSLNHTCAKSRADINRLIRKTWCTTKKAERLDLHLSIFALYHNRQLVARKRV